MGQVEYKTKWAALLQDLPRYFQRNDRCNVSERQSVDALHQLYGYMMFNENKYGILNNMQYAWFFQRVETANIEGRTLQYYGPINIDADSAPSPSMLKAFVGIILLSETESTWSHTSMCADEGPPGRYFGTSIAAIRNRDTAIAHAQSYHSTPVAGSYPVLPLDPRLCRFKRSSVQHSPQRGCTLRATLARSDGGNLDVFCKIVDLFRSSDAISALDTEVCRYAALQNLQGVVVPRVYGYYNVWGLLKLLALEDVGTAIPEDASIDTEMRMQMKSALTRIHSAGYVHGDIARRNFCKRANRIFIIDLETLIVGSTVEMEDELAAVDVL
jgi:hypothetical protein